MKDCLVLFSLILSMSIALAGQTFADKDLILHLPFDQGTGTEAIDESQYGNNGTVENGNWVAGKFGNALEFNGSTSRLEIPSSDSLNPEKELSVAMWFKATDQLPTAEGARFMDKWGRPEFNAKENSGYVMTFFPGANENRLVFHYNMNDFGKFGNALEFNGSTSRLEIPSSDSLNPEKGGQGLCPPFRRQMAPYSSRFGYRRCRFESD
jgi:hypothetical protein